MEPNDIAFLAAGVVFGFVLHPIGAAARTGALGVVDRYEGLRQDLKAMHTDRATFTYWVVRDDAGHVHSLPIPDRHLRRIEARLRAEHGPLVQEWWREHRHQVHAHEDSKSLIERRILEQEVAHG